MASQSTLRPSLSRDASLDRKGKRPPAESGLQVDLEKTPTTTSVKREPSTRTIHPETDLDRGIVGWDGQDDPANPMNFAPSRKWTLLGLVSAATFISPLASSIFSPALEDLALDMRITNETLLSFTVSIYLLGYTVRLPVVPMAGICANEP